LRIARKRDHKGGKDKECEWDLGDHKELVVCTADASALDTILSIIKTA